MPRPTNAVIGELKRFLPKIAKANEELDTLDEGVSLSLLEPGERETRARIMRFSEWLACEPLPQS